MYKRSNVYLLIFLLPVISCSQTRENWISKPTAQWPSITLSNNFRFNNGDHYINPSFKYAATGFLVDIGKDTLAVTSKHLLWAYRYNTNNSNQLQEELQQWTMRANKNSRDSVVAGRLLNADAAEIRDGENAEITRHDDWIIFSVKQSSPNIYPLKPRFTPVKEGEKVYVLSGAYEGSPNTVREGKVSVQRGRYIMIDHDTKINLSHSGGSPVIDANGYLVGILSYSTSDGKTEKPITVVLSTEYLQDLLKKK
jgi:hypothetical protein